MMPDTAYIARQLRGAWNVMLGRPEGLEALDISEAGFWRSLTAVLVSLPPLLLSWTITGREIAASSSMTVPSVVWRLSVIEMAAWFLPLLVLAFTARPLGFGDRFVHFFIASNWASAVLVYLASPYDLIELFAPDADNLHLIAGLIILTIVIVAMVRLIHLTLRQSYPVSIAVLLFLLLLTFLTVDALEAAFGLVYPENAAG